MGLGQTLCDVFNVVVDVSRVPLEWMRSFIVPLFKTGDPQTPGNYRGIALGSCVAKVLARVLGREVGMFAEECILTEEQGGFRATRRCADQFVILRSVCEMRMVEGKETWLAFLDVSKAYDTVWRQGLWEKMEKYGVKRKLIEVCKALYRDVQASVLLDREQSRWFEVENSLRQGCPLSPLFS